MRRFLILSLASVLLLASATEMFARPGGGGGGYRGGYGGYRGGYGYGGWGYGGWGVLPYYGYGYGGGYWPGYYGSGSYYSADPYYATPTYPYAGGITQAPPVTSRPSFYPAPGSATVTVAVPDPSAQVWFDDTLTQQRGTERVFNTPPLQGGGTYTVKTRWMENGKAVSQQRTVHVDPGESVRVDFHASATDPASTGASRQ
jgi:uncharacterized protein (TIGR03000 family)